ncbi:hypothetical protein [Enterococcus sp. AZ149]|uniref:hypothetical protein n=1 Tax=Enterococcus sp. AZ149 TaxID=2774686 RepID=UPI003F1E7D8F
MIEALTKTKKQEIEKKTKELIESQGIDYEEWRFTLHFNYLMNHINDLSVTNKPEGVYPR